MDTRRKHESEICKNYIELWGRTNPVRIIHSSFWHMSDTVRSKELQYEQWLRVLNWVRRWSDVSMSIMSKCTKVCTVSMRTSTKWWWKWRDELCESVEHMNMEWQWNYWAVIMKREYHNPIWIWSDEYGDWIFNVEGGVMVLHCSTADSFCWR